MCLAWSETPKTGFLMMWLIKIQTPEKIAVIILKFEQCGFYHGVLHPKDAHRMTNSIDLGQVAPHSLPRPVCPKI